MSNDHRTAFERAVTPIIKWPDCPQSRCQAHMRCEWPDKCDLHVTPIASTEHAMSEWQPIETAPKGGGADLVTDPNWVNPPKILLLFDRGQQAVCCWDWYYAKGGNGYRGISAWVEPISAEQIALSYDEPTHWMPLPEPPK